MASLSHALPPNMCSEYASLVSGKRAYCFTAATNACVHLYIVKMHKHTADLHTVYKKYCAFSLLLLRNEDAIK